MWYEVFKKDEIKNNELKDITIHGIPLLIANINNNIYITDLYCTHEQTSLSEGFIDKCHIVCSNHFAEFDPKNGKVIAGPEGDDEPIKDLKTYKSKIENDKIMVDLP